jgi:hypothetical protein
MKFQVHLVVDCFTYFCGVLVIDNDYLKRKKNHFKISCIIR